MKKDKHITINFDPVEYKQIEDKAKEESRTITNYLYLVVKKHLEGLEK